jgi:hypothetical protein
MRIRRVEGAKFVSQSQQTVALAQNESVALVLNKHSVYLNQYTKCAKRDVNERVYGVPRL